jgi:F0F1-type ATP synthase assembly protein I
MDPKKTDNPLKKSSSFYRYSSLALQMILTILLFVAGGFYLDKWLKLPFPWFTLVLTLVGVFGSLYAAIRKL